jgi:adenylate cyclase
MLAAQLIAGAVLLCREMAWLQPAELSAYDRLVVAWAGQTRSDRILLVTATEADVGRYGWPLRDEHLAALLERLISWGAGPIGVDIYRDRPEPPGTDMLAALLDRHAGIFWAFKLAEVDDPGIPPPPALAGTRFAAFADVAPDAGGVVRRGLLAATEAGSGQVARSLGAALAEHHVGRRLRAVGDAAALGHGRILLLREGFGPYARVDAAGHQTLLDFRGGRNRFRQFGLGELMGSDAAAPLVRGRIVLIGTGAPSVKDSFATPFSTGRDGGEPFLGVTLHAHLTDQLIRIHAGEASSLAALPWALDAAMIWACATAAAGASLAVGSAGLAFLALLAGLAMIAGAVYAAFGLGLLLPGVPAILAWTGGAVSAIWALHGFGLRERLRLRRAFEHYLDPQIIRTLLDADVLPSFGGEHRDLSVLFTDISGFTTLAETMPAAQVAALLRDYFDGVCAAVLACGGLVAEFAGDSVLALFGAPQRQDDHADRAVDAALRIDEFAHGFSARQQAQGVAFGATRIGVHSGPALVGNIGTRARLKYGAVGDVLNTASRIEELNKQIGTRIAVSGETVRRCARHRFRPIGEFVLRGRRAALPIATPLAPTQGEDSPHVMRHEAAHAALHTGDPAAQERSPALRRDDSGDPSIALHCARLAAGKPGARLDMGEA